MMNIESYNSYRDILRVEYETRKARNPHYSLRAFANSIGIGSGALSEILAGKRNLGPSKAKEILTKLNLDESEKDYFLTSVTNNKNSKKEDGLEHEAHHLNLEVFEIVSSPLCMSLLALADVEDFRLEENWLATRLDATPSEVTYSLKLMRSVGLVEVINGVEKICEDFVFSTDGIPSQSIRNYHHQMLGKAHDALDEVSVELRDIRGLSFAVDTDDLDKIKKDILNFQKKMVKKYQTNKTLKEVYHLQVSLFPLSFEDEL